MSSLTDAQRKERQFVTKTVTQLGTTFKIHGRKGTMEYLGIVPDVASDDLAAAGISKTIQRPGGRRARWLGDTEGAPYAASTAKLMLYPTAGGNAIPGVPLRIVNLDETDPATGINPEGTVSIEGPRGAFVAWLANNPPSFTCKVYSASGKPYKGVIKPDGTP
jgi:hypothetical protein